MVLHYKCNNKQNYLLIFFINIFNLRTSLMICTGILSILATTCCMPIGMMALYLNISAVRDAEQGHMEIARIKQKIALCAGITGIIMSVLITIMFLFHIMIVIGPIPGPTSQSDYYDYNQPLNKTYYDGNYYYWQPPPE